MTWAQLQPYVASFARHAGTYLAGAIAAFAMMACQRFGLSACGLDNGQTTMIAGLLTSAITWGAMQAWSIIEKRQRRPVSVNQPPTSLH